jgi:hypothetical protein
VQYVLDRSKFEMTCNLSLMWISNKRKEINMNKYHVDQVVTQ